MSKDLTSVHDLLYSLGVTSNYIGFFQTLYAVLLCAEQPERLLLVTKWLYPEVAKQYGTTWTAVERNIRTVGSIIWRENRPLLEQLAHGPLEQKPRNRQLLAILSASLDGPQLLQGVGEAAYEAPRAAPLPANLKTVLRQPQNMPNIASGLSIRK